jgi:phage N-6-adenine-methyltransferase
MIWATPQKVFDKLNQEFRFTVDVCADHENKKVTPYFTRLEGLSATWRGRCFLNPPYGREIGEWMRKAQQSALEGAIVVALVPTRTNAPWWHDYALKADEIRFVRKKLAFESEGHTKHGVPFTGHAIVVFGKTRRSPKVSSWEQPAGGRPVVR